MGVLSVLWLLSGFRLKGLYTLTDFFPYTSLQPCWLEDCHDSSNRGVGGLVDDLGFPFPSWSLFPPGWDDSASSASLRRAWREGRFIGVGFLLE